MEILKKLIIRNLFFIWDVDKKQIFLLINCNLDKIDLGYLYFSDIKNIKLNKLKNKFNKFKLKVLF